MEQFFEDYKTFKALLVEDLDLDGKAKNNLLVAFVNHYPYPFPGVLPPANFGGVANV